MNESDLYPQWATTVAIGSLDDARSSQARWLATENDGEHITLETPSGKKINAVLRKFSAEDRAYIQSQLDAHR